MNQIDEKLADYYRQAESWSADRDRALSSSRMVAWIVASIAITLAVLEALAIVLMLPLKTVVPYTLLVDRQTGYVQALKPLERDRIAPDQALVRSFLAQYVLARESFDIDALNDTYKKVALWSAGDARNSYIAGMQASNPRSLLATLPRGALMQSEIRSISSLGADTALIRFVTTLTLPGGQPQHFVPWVAVAKYRFSGAEMTSSDRLLNPLGFQVLRYHRDPENLSEPQGSTTAGQATAAPASTSSPGARAP